MRAVGLDACRGKWLAVVLDDGRFAEARLASSAATLATVFSHATAIGVDIPIGLPDTPDREADRAARKFVGSRRGSVFPTFPSLVLEAPTYEDAKTICEARGWRKPSLQSYGMRHRILEITALAAEDERIIEVHPEVSFRELLGRTLASKHSPTGATERRFALADVGIHLPDLRYPVDDLLDAGVVAWTATRYARTEAVPLPEGHDSRIGAIWR
jgi:predicted RNase H-like nuclease